MLNNQQLLNLIAVGLLLVGAESALAQSTGNSSTSTNDSTTQVLFKPPPDDKKPDKTTGAGSRRDLQCPQDATSYATTDASSNKPSLMALVPTTNYGWTLKERPTFWVYLPQTSAKQVVLSLKEEGIQHHSQTFLPITGAPGVIGIKPSDESPALEVGKNYQWAVVLVCGERPSPNDPAIASWVSRVASPRLHNTKQYQKTGLEQAVWYSDRGIWYDALTVLAQAKRSQPYNNTLVDMWANFLKSAGLGAIATESLRY
jgi:hypothetical protein